MQMQDIPKRTGLKPLKLAAGEVPHLTIEPNSTCNIRCQKCYRKDRSVVKPLEDVKREIDLGMERRNLESISLVGGEPTLHPDILEIIEYVKSRGLVCGLLTNGVVFLDDRKDALLDRMISAGVDRFVIHVDDGQRHIHDDIEQVRTRLFDKMEQRRVYFSLSLTLYKGDETILPELMRRYARYRFFDGVLTTLAMDHIETDEPDGSWLQGPPLEDVYRSISRALKIEPAAYIPSSLDDDCICWLMFFYYINYKTGQTYGISPRFNRLFRQIHRLVKGRHVFAMTVDPTWFKSTSAFTGLADVLMQPSKLPALLKLFRQSNLLDDLRFHYIIIQKPPSFNHQHQRVQICYHCPDATIRNGRVTPVCMADQISPLDGGPAESPEAAQLAGTVYQHLEEPGY